MTPFDTAIAFAAAHETPWARDPAADPGNWGIHLQDPPPWNVLRGPVHARGPSSGSIVHRGVEVASWGEPDRADLTFSIAKTYLALLAGVAHDAGLLPDPDEPVRARVPAGIGFDTPRAAAVTWTQLLQQTSEWEGTCLGLPDTVDRYRTVAYGGDPATGRKGDARPLPEVLGESILGPLGATSDWRWVGYDDAWVELPDAAGGTRRVQSVPGGTHWGGGVSISARDQARVGGLMLRGGVHEGRRLLSSDWIERMMRPCPIAPWYGMLVWRNGGPRPVYPAASASSVFMIGAGGHVTWIDPERDLVVASRWVQPDATDALIRHIATALF